VLGKDALLAAELGDRALPAAALRRGDLQQVRGRRRCREQEGEKEGGEAGLHRRRFLGDDV
jgi:hypothetical protein